MTNSFSVVGANGAWHEVVLAHQYARGKTWFYVDGALIATVSERLTPIGFILGGKGSATARPDSPAQADYQNWMVYRSMLNAEEVEAQHQGRRCTMAGSGRNASPFALQRHNATRTVTRSGAANRTR